MNPLLIGALLGGGAGLLKGSGDKKNYREEQKLNAVKAMYSPWTGIHPTNPQRPDMMNSALSGALRGASFGALFNPSEAATSSYPGGDVSGGPSVQNAIMDDYGGPTNQAGVMIDAHNAGVTPMQEAMFQDNPWGYQNMGPAGSPWMGGAPVQPPMRPVQPFRTY